MTITDKKHIFVTGYVPDAVKFMSRCSVMITPLFQGSGTRTKILEAMVLKKPVVSASRGAEEFLVENGKNIIIEDNSEVFAMSIISLLRDRNMRKSIGEEVYKTAVSHYAWALIGNSLYFWFRG